MVLKSICEGVNYFIIIIINLTLGASPSPAPPDRERGKLLAAENRQKIRQASRRLDTSINRYLKEKQQKLDVNKFLIMLRNIKISLWMSL